MKDIFLSKNIFVISLKSRQDRKKLFEETNSKFIEYNFFDAINGYEIDYDWILERGFDIDKNWRDPEFKTPILKGEVGCFLSHYYLWKKCLDEDKPIIILEDDAILKHKIPFNQLDNLINDYDLIYFDWREQFNVVKINDYLSLPVYPYCTHGYLITPLAARELIGDKNSIIPVDEYITNHLHKFNVCGYNKENRFLSSWDRDILQTDIPDGIDTIKTNYFLEKRFTMNNELLENGYAVIRNFIEIDDAVSISNKLKKQISLGDCIKDTQVSNAPAMYNPIVGVELLVNKNEEVSKIIEEDVLPTYCYSRNYCNQSVLTKHVDRSECEISLTVHLEGDEPWEFFVETPNKETKSVVLESGDAIIYLGTERPHWREPYEGESYTQIFLHYVRKNGEYADRYFDRTKKKIDYSDMIYHVDNFLDTSICDKVIEEYNRFDEWQQSKISSGEPDIDVRNCSSIDISYDDVMSKNQEKRKEYDDMFFQKVKEIYQRYESKYPEMQLTCAQDEGYTLLKYSVGGKYIEHTDHFKDRPRSLTIIFNLNDDYEGGELTFWGRTKIYKLKKGDGIIFPSNFMYPHEIMPVTSGTRYSMITWMI